MAMRAKTFAGILTLFLIFSASLAYAENSQLVKDSEFDMQPYEQWKEFIGVNEPLFSLSFQSGYAELYLASGTKQSASQYYYGMYQSVGAIPSDTSSIEITIKNGKVVNPGTWKERLRFWYSTTYWSLKMDPVSYDKNVIVLNSTNAPNLFSNLGKSMYFIVELYFPSKPGTDSYGLDIDYVYVNITEGSGERDIIRDPSFDTDWQYWSYEQHGPEQWNVSFDNGLATILGGSTNSISSENPASCLLYQSISIPDGKIENATLSVYVSSQSNVKIKLGFKENGEWLWSATQWAPQSAQELSYNVTEVLSSVAGKSIVLEVGALVDYNTSNGDYSFLLKLDYVRLYVTWIPEEGNSNNGWHGSNNGWHGSGSYWTGHGVYWWRTSTANASYVQSIANRIQLSIDILASIIIAVLWVRAGIDYFSEDRRERGKEELQRAIAGTLILALAVLGSTWLLGRWLAGGAVL